ncbi:unnamed protein product, partial [marine sediment metagenome]
TFDNKLITKTSDDVDLNYYFKEISNSDGFEYEVVLKEKPTTNVISFPIESENLNFFYQPALDVEMNNENCNATDCEGSHRPIDVVGSYAVYHSSKRDNEYMTGKAFHIYRPKIIDNKNNFVWGELNIENDLMTITISQEFLDKAVYPVVIDPGFGFAGIGASYSISSTEGGKFTSGGSGDLDSITAYFVDDGGWSSGIEYQYAIYKDSDDSKLDVTDSYTTDGDDDDGWYTMDFSDGAGVTAQDYWLYKWGTEND